MGVLVLRYSEAGEEGRNSAALQLSDGLGVVLGVGVAGAIFAALHDPASDDGPVFGLIWLLLAAVGVLAALVAPRAARPAATGVPVRPLSGNQPADG